MKKFFGFIILLVSFVVISSQHAFSDNIEFKGKTYTKTEIKILEKLVRDNAQILPGIKTNFQPFSKPNADYIARLEYLKIAIIAQQKNNDLAKQIKVLQEQVDALDQRNAELEKKVETLQAQPTSVKNSLDNIYYVIITIVALLFITILTSSYYVNKKMRKLADSYAEKINSMNDQSKQLAEANVHNLNQKATINQLNREKQELEAKINELNQNNGIVKQPDEQQIQDAREQQYKTIRALEDEKATLKNQVKELGAEIGRLNRLLTDKHKETQGKDSKANQNDSATKKTTPTVLDFLNKTS